jgi:hypothetical protein
MGSHAGKKFTLVLMPENVPMKMYLLWFHNNYSETVAEDSCEFHFLGVLLQNIQETNNSKFIFILTKNTFNL